MTTTQILYVSLKSQMNQKFYILIIIRIPSTLSHILLLKLTKVPDQIRIKIYTVAGRLVREINVYRDQLNFDFNRIFWDGRDEDGDLLANGVYIYKIISEDAGDKVTITNKLAIVR
ncbi:MAG: hypothetical protein U5K00_13515 [Melioribacteraceae bacterium]|nr:hypothetical protein [Melioribacteraceae bacterium]